MKNSVLIFLLIICATAFAQVPKLGNDTLLDVATWNVEWLGESGYGPTDEALQYNNVKNLLAQTDFDIIALQEMSNGNTFFNLSDFLFSKYGALNSTFQATQKMCFFYKKSMFEVIPDLSKNILLQYASDEFATRPPLQVALQTVGGTKTDTLYFIVVHMKANTGNTAAKQESYNRRKAAAGYLKTYIEQDLKNKKCIVLGDWNDDLNKSIFNGGPSPYTQLLDAGYQFATKPLDDAGKHSYAFGSGMIDHIMLANGIDSFYITASAQVFDGVGSYISNYSNTTSDHYPVYSFFDWKKLTTAYTAPPPPTGLEEFENSTISIYPNPASNHIILNKTAGSVVIYDAMGREKLNITSPQTTLDISILQNGMYFFRIEAEGKVSYERVLVSK
jgi:exonuclease III